MTVFEIAAVVVGREHNPGRTPGEFIAEGIGVVGQGGQAAAIGVETGDFTAGVFDFMDDFHGGHVVDAGIDANFVEEDKAFGFDLFVEGLHGGLNVGGGDEIFVEFHTQVGNFHVMDPGQKADDDVGLGDDFFEGLLIFDVELFGDALGVMVDEFFGFADGS